jgi:DNA-binding NarL/FixJ family response regulator
MTRSDGPIRVLIADDDPRVRAALRTFLSAHPGIDVVAEADGATRALEMAREHAPTVALVDVYLPERNAGLELVRALADLDVPTVAISLEDGVRESALDAGAHQFLDKASVPDHLLGALARYA